MAAARLLCLTLVFIPFICAQKKTFSFTSKVFKPKGLEISVAEDPIIKFVQFEVVLYNETKNYVGHVRDIVFHQTKGSWVFFNSDLELKIGFNVLCNYIIGTSIHDPKLYEKDANHTTILYLYGVGYKDTYQFAVSYLEEITKVDPKKCFSISKVPNRDVCSDDVIFEDNFNVLKEENWRIEHYIPLDHPEYPFVSYQNLQGNDTTVFVKDGHLHIRPRLQNTITGFDENSLYAGTLDLHSGCTGRVCKIQAMGPSILPPIVSGRISLRSAFKYGTVHVRAKLPLGDWIYPEILLEPMYNKYGSLHYSSGVLKIAMARGNRELDKPKLSSNVLKGGPLLNSKCKGVFDFYSKETFDGKSWGDDFHVYSITWAPGSIEMFVDGNSWVVYRPGSGGLRSWLPKTCRGSWYKLLDRQDGTSKIAPFDDYFFVSLGLAVGGVFEFPDDLTTGDGYQKPWKNNDPRALVQFWDKRQDWLGTWTQPELIVDYVKIVAL